MYPRSWDDGVHRDTSHGASNANNYTVRCLQKQRGESAIPLHVNSDTERNDPRRKKKGGRVKGFLTDCDFFDTIRASAKDSCSLLLPVACNMGFLPRSRAGIRVMDRGAF